MKYTLQTWRGLEWRDLIHSDEIKTIQEAAHVIDNQAVRILRGKMVVYRNEKAKEVEKEQRSETV